MVLRGQPVGEQGAADRWTALDPHQAGSGAGAPRGVSPGRPPSLSICVHEGPPGPFFRAAISVYIRKTSPVDLLGLRNPSPCRVTIVSTPCAFAFVPF